MHDTVLMPVLTFEETLLKELRQKAEKQFEKLKAKYASEVKIKTSVIFGTVSLMIPEYIRDQKADLVVMGTHGASGVREYIIGSNAEKIVRRSPVPVLCVKKYVKLSSIRTIIFPNAQDTETHDNFVMKVKSLQSFFKAKIHVVWINTPTNFTRDSLTHKRLEAFVKKIHN
jgi:histidinol-phosphate/aromatic aminotransferase/cobyric acid decarboxylase-like protein